jgi:6-carboxyhexanoate--CoA ligase
MWSVRMRASREAKSQQSKVKRPGLDEVHISGAEGLYEFSDIEKITKEYLQRAMGHPKGEPDKVVITFEEVRGGPFEASLLPFSTVRCDSPDAARGVIREMLTGAGISRGAVRTGIRIVTAKAAMPGAALIRSESARRAEPDRRRGTRVSRLGIRKDAGKTLARKLARNGINTTTVKEAIVLASKVASCRGVIAELCASDDPDYTTGYVASRVFGYVRIPNIKRKGSVSGGRVFFIDERADVERIIKYLETTPVIMKM